MPYKGLKYRSVARAAVKATANATKRVKFPIPHPRPKKTRARFTKNLLAVPVIITDHHSIRLYDPNAMPLQHIFVGQGEIPNQNQESNCTCQCKQT